MRLLARAGPGSPMGPCYPDMRDGPSSCSQVRYDANLIPLYTLSEDIADGVIHVVGITGALVASYTLLTEAWSNMPAASLGIRPGPQLPAPALRERPRLANTLPVLKRERGPPPLFGLIASRRRSRSALRRARRSRRSSPPRTGRDSWGLSPTPSASWRAPTPTPGPAAPPLPSRAPQ